MGLAHALSGVQGTWRRPRLLPIQADAVHRVLLWYGHTQSS